MPLLSISGLRLARRLLVSTRGRDPARSLVRKLHASRSLSFKLANQIRPVRVDIVGLHVSRQTFTPCVFFT